jgi:hypothetical protein
VEEARRALPDQVRRLAALEAIASLSCSQVCPPRSHLHLPRGLTHGEEYAQEAIPAKLHSTCLKAIASHLKKVDIDADERAIVSLAHLMVHPDQRTADAAKTNLNSFLASHGDELPDRVEKELMAYCVAQWNKARVDQQVDTATRLGQVVCGTIAVSKLPPFGSSADRRCAAVGGQAVATGVHHRLSQAQYVVVPLVLLLSLGSL